MSRYTPQTSVSPQLVRPSDLWIVQASRAAVDRAMEKVHDRNPAGYHHQRPSLTFCHYDEDCPFVGH